MSRTVVIRKIWKLSEKEVMRLSNYSSGDITRDYENTWSLFGEEIETTERYQHLTAYMRKIVTSDGVEMYVCGNEFLALCSDKLLAGAIEEEIDYTKFSYADITDEFSGKEIEASETVFRRNFTTGKLEPATRNLKFKFPPKEEGVRIIFFDDMD